MIILNFDSVLKYVIGFYNGYKEHCMSFTSHGYTKLCIPDYENVCIPDDEKIKQLLVEIRKT